MKLLLRLLPTCCLLAIWAGPAAAQEPAAATNAAPAQVSKWIVEPYFLVPNMSGSAGVGGLVGDVDANSGDILGALDIGGMLYVERHGAKWAYSLDTMYMNLGAEESTPLGTVDLDMKQLGMMGAGYRRIAPWAEAMLALQYNGIEAGLTGSGPLAVDRSGDQDWVDPYVGVRLMTPGAGSWRFGFLGAVGGFGVGSDFAWQAFPQAGYRVSELFEITGGFRAIDMDYEGGDGDATFVYDMTTYGGQLGGRFHF